ncbi:MAG: ATP-dependent 6-phosphofructokinase [Syntrophorhabdaceae bacterium]|nr:ATP-dependent 6-phosphofructokinase [Syntrophorhabdaceae bacterium]
MNIRKIAVNTGGGDAPGLNAVIRAVTLSALRLGWEVVGIREGYFGLLNMPPEQGLIPLTRDKVRGILNQGGTILGTTNRGNPFEYPVEVNGKIVAKDRSGEIIEAFRRHEFDALVAIGGDGSLEIANRLYKKGIPVIGVPKTIDNDLSATFLTFGFDTAVATVTDALDKLHSTAESHNRVMVVETMGRSTGWIALHAGVAGSADVILIPEIPFELEKICDSIRTRDQMGRHYSIIVAAEGAAPVGGQALTKGVKEIGREIRLGGIAEWLAGEIAARTGKETRFIVLGHLQRGGGPSSFDRLMALRFGAAAVRFLAEGQVGVMVAFQAPLLLPVPLEQAIAERKRVPLDNDTIATARSLGICMGSSLDDP